MYRPLITFTREILLQQPLKDQVRGRQLCKQRRRRFQLQIVREAEYVGGGTSLNVENGLGCFLQAIAKDGMVQIGFRFGDAFDGIVLGGGTAAQTVG